MHCKRKYSPAVCTASAVHRNLMCNSHPLQDSHDLHDILERCHVSHSALLAVSTSCQQASAEEFYTAVHNTDPAVRSLGEGWSLSYGSTSAALKSSSHQLLLSLVLPLLNLALSARLQSFTSSARPQRRISGVKTTPQCGVMRTRLCLHTTHVWSRACEENTDAGQRGA